MSLDPPKDSSPRDWNYPIPEFGCIYTSDVLIFRSDELDGFKFYNEPESMSIIASHAYVKPKTNGTRMEKKFEQGTREKIRNIFLTCLFHVLIFFVKTFSRDTIAWFCLHLDVVHLKILQNTFHKSFLK
jgi:hypothetical protein